MTSLVPLIETTRGGTPECLHFGAVAVTDTTGRVLASAGDPHWFTFTRSTLKALQALPFMEADGPRKMGFTRENIAMMCASHSGEPMHVAQVQEMQKRAAGYSSADEIAKLQGLLSAGAITQAEFDAAKARALA